MTPNRSEIERKVAGMITEKSSFVSHWRELSDYINPRASRFFTTDRNRGDKRNQNIYNDTATDAVRTLSSGMMGGLTSPARPWFKLRVSDPEVAKAKAVKIWLDDVQRVMGDVFLKSNLYQVLPMAYDDLGTYGSMAFALVDDEETIIRAHHCPIGSFSLGTSYRGSIDSWAYEYERSQYQLVRQFGIDNVSESVKVGYETNAAEVWYPVVHLVMPNPQHDPAKGPSKYKKYLSVIYEKGGTKDKWLEVAGYDEFPIMAARWQVTGEDIYATKCPGMQSLPDIKMLQLLEKRKIQAIEKMSNPPVTAPTSLRNSTVNLLPGGVTFVDVNQGSQGVQSTYMVNPHLQELEMVIRGVEDRIRRSFFADMFLAISNLDRAGITATEISERREEKMLILGPVLERLNDELFDPLIKRTFAIMERRGMLPPPPPEMQMGTLAIEYISILSQAQKLVGVVSLEKLTAFIGNVMQAFPEAGDRYDADAAIEDYADMIGAGPRIVRDAVETAKLRSAKAQQAQAEAQMVQAQQGANVAQTMAQTPITEDTALGAMLQRLQGGVPA